MNERSKAPEVEEFLACFAKLKDACDDDPDIVEETASSDPDFHKLCSQIWHLKLQLDGDQLEHPEQFIAPVGTDFIKAWRDYNERYQSPVLFVVVFSGLKSRLKNLPKRPAQPLEDDHVWAPQAEAIEWPFGLLKELSSKGIFDEEETKNSMDEAVLWWEFLKSGTGLDLEGIFRRKMLVPFVLVPHHVSARHGNAQPSLFDLLREAQRAFIFGVLLSSISLMRATLERLLTEHYSASGADLKFKIDSVYDEHLSWRLKQKLHDIRRLANRVLHTGGSEENVNRAMPSEREVAKHLDTLRTLIENAPAIKPNQRL